MIQVCRKLPMSSQLQLSSRTPRSLDLLFSVLALIEHIQHGIPCHRVVYFTQSCNGGQKVKCDLGRIRTHALSKKCFNGKCHDTATEAQYATYEAVSTADDGSCSSGMYSHMSPYGATIYHGPVLHCVPKIAQSLAEKLDRVPYIGVVRIVR